MIHYHGTPITPRVVLDSMHGRHFCISFERPEQLAACRALGQSLMLDNGAFSAWKCGAATNWGDFYVWVEVELGPADFAVIPDVIGGSEAENEELIRQWPHGERGAPVWHLNESLDRLRRLVEAWPLTCLGSTNEYDPPLSYRWERRMDEVFNSVCSGRFVPRLHGLRMMAASNRRWPLASVDSTDVARNHNRKDARTMAERWDASQVPHRWEQRLVDVCMFDEDIFWGTGPELRALRKEAG